MTFGTGTDAGGFVYVVDNLEFGAAAPNPATLAIIGLGLVGLALSCRYA